MNKTQTLIQSIREKNYVKADNILSDIIKEKLEIKISSVDINKNKKDI